MRAGRQRQRLLGLALSLCSSAAWGQTNYDGALIGGRSSLLGGTGVASGTDAAAPFQNPAATVDIEGTSFVFSTFFVQINQRNIPIDDEQVAEIRRGSATLEETQIRVLPQSTCIFFDLFRDQGKRKGAHKMSVCFAEPESANFELNGRLLAETTGGQVARLNRLLAQQYTRRVYAAGWAHALSDKFSIGVTPMLQEVSFRDTEALSVLYADTDDAEQIVGSPATNRSHLHTRKASAYGLTALLGVHFTPAPGWKTGLSVETPTLHLAGSYSGLRTTETVTGDAEQYLEDSGSARFTYPLRVAAGVSGKLGNVGFEVDAYFRPPRSDFLSIDAERVAVNVEGGIATVAEREDFQFEQAVDPVANVGVGVEIPLAKDWALLTGVLTDFSGLPTLTSGAPTDEVFFRQRLDAIHGSVGVGWTPRVGSILLGLRGFYGEGELVTSNTSALPPTARANPQSQWGLSAVISGQLSLEMLKVVDPTGLIQ